jgi:hypothetical protein
MFRQIHAFNKMQESGETESRKKKQSVDAFMPFSL